MSDTPLRKKYARREKIKLPKDFFQPDTTRKTACDFERRMFKLKQISDRVQALKHGELHSHSLYGTGAALSHSVVDGAKWLLDNLDVLNPAYRDDFKRQTETLWHGTLRDYMRVLKAKSEEDEEWERQD